MFLVIKLNFNNHVKHVFPRCVKVFALDGGAILSLSSLDYPYRIHCNLLRSKLDFPSVA
jgi:hypothetical protein